MKNANAIEQFDPDKQRELDQLLEKNQFVALDSDEAARLRKLVDEAERLMLRNAEGNERGLVSSQHHDDLLPQQDALPSQLHA